MKWPDMECIEFLRYICNMRKTVTAKEAEKISKALGDPYRLKIMELIKKENDWTQCVSIVENINLAQSTVSHHLKQLVDSELLFSEKDGRNAKFLINEEKMNAYVNFLKPLHKSVTYLFIEIFR